MGASQRMQQIHTVANPGEAKHVPGFKSGIRRLVSAFKLPRFQVARLLERDANNLDLLRLICSCLVIYGHAFLLAPDPAWPAGDWDPFTRFRYAGVYSASVAVKLFFFISGLLVTNSLLVKRSVSHYFIGRVFRIWPALTVLLLASALVIGPCLTHLKLKEYFSLLSVYQYVTSNLLMWMQGDLPGVFTGNPFPALINGALWTIPYEIAAYFALLLLALLGVLRSPILVGLLLFGIVIDPLLPEPALIRWLAPNPQFTYLPPCFAIGAFFAIYKDRLFISAGTSLITLTVFWVLRDSALGPLLFFFSLFVTLLYISGLPGVRNVRLRSDVSYGTFLWGFPIQQIVAAKYGHHGFLFNFGVSLALALCMGGLSWHLIERPAIRVGRRLADRWTGRPALDALREEPFACLKP